MLKPGDKLVVLRPFVTMADVVYRPGDILELVEPTGHDPFGHGMLPDTPHNWVVKCKVFTPPDPRTVWGGIYQLMDEGLIKVQD